MAERYPLQIITPERTVFEGEVESLVVPAANGYLGVLAHHAPLMAALSAGEVSVTLADGVAQYYAITGGFLEVRRDGVTVLPDSAERPEEIDIARAEAARERALRRLKELTADTDLARAETALRRATARLRVAARYRS